MKKISIIIPARNEEVTLPMVLRDLNDALAKYREAEVEVICVDDHSTDSTAKVARSFGAKVVENKRKGGKGMALRAGFEAATGDIREELRAVMSGSPAFEPYVRSDPGRPLRDQAGMADNPDWGAFYLWKDGERIEENAARCPRTMRALESVPLCRVTNRSPSVLFSLLRPGAHIPAHNGMVNTRLICHLPLIVPPGCEFRVGNETRPWVEGKAWVFDDTIEHEAWNRSAETRVILLFEIWRPELAATERALVEAMFAAIDAHSGQKPQWEI